MKKILHYAVIGLISLAAKAQTNPAITSWLQHFLQNTSTMKIKVDT